MWGMLAKRVGRNNQQSEGYGPKIETNQIKQRVIHEELTGLRTLTARGFVSTNRLRAIERSAAQLDGDFGALNSDVARLQEAIGESRLQMVSMDRRMPEEVAPPLREVQVRPDQLQRSEERGVGKGCVR